jgi:hypothetical protein
MSVLEDPRLGDGRLPPEEPARRGRSLVARGGEEALGVGRDRRRSLKVWQVLESTPFRQP